MQQICKAEKRATKDSDEQMEEIAVQILPYWKTNSQEKTFRPERRPKGMYECNQISYEEFKYAFAK